MTTKQPPKNNDALLEANERDFAQAVVELRAKRPKICAVAANVLASWYKEEAARRVENQSHITSSLTNERLGEMKREVNSLADRAKEITAKHFGSKCWAYEENLVEKKDTGYSPTTDFVKASLREARCELGPILAKYGFMSDGDIQRQSFIEFVNTPAPEAFSTATAEYMNDAIKVQKLLNEQWSLKREQQSSDAKSRWNEL